MMSEDGTSIDDNDNLQSASVTESQEGTLDGDDISDLQSGIVQRSEEETSLNADDNGKSHKWPPFFAGLQTFFNAVISHDVSNHGMSNHLHL